VSASPTEFEGELETLLARHTDPEELTHELVGLMLEHFGPYGFLTEADFLVTSNPDATIVRIFIPDYGLLTMTVTPGAQPAVNLDQSVKEPPAWVTGTNTTGSVN
jgi:hypothetical protein